MRRAIFGGACSLDGMFARPDGGVDWLLWSDEVAAIMAEVWTTFDTVVMGRKTYQAAVAAGQAGGYPGVRNYVFSRTLSEVPSGVTLVHDDAAEFVRALKEESGRDLCVMGGGEMAHSLFEAGLIDQVGLNVHPLLLGSGVPVFHPMPRQIDLELVECRPLKNGCVYVLYDVRPWT
jgi:dihydrofolate reductase